MPFTNPQSRPINEISCKAIYRYMTDKTYLTDIGKTWTFSVKLLLAYDIYLD